MNTGRFLAALKRAAPLVIDGGLATQLEAQGCDISNALWSASLLLDQPEAIVAANRAFIQAGAECIATASYQASREGFAQRGIPAEKSDELMKLSVELAVQARGNSDALIAASIGPYGAILHDGSEYRGDYGVSADALRTFHAERLNLFDKSEADILACETIPSKLEAEVLAELLAVCETPAWVSFSCPDAEHISDGTPVEEAAAVFTAHPGVLAVGINCTPPQYVTQLITRLGEVLPDKAIIAYPNSGETWDAETGEWFGTASPIDFANAARDWVSAGADIVGGCCRTDPEYISVLRAAVQA